MPGRVAAETVVPRRRLPAVAPGWVSLARPKSRILTIPSAVDHHVLGLQIPMDDAGRVGPSQSLGDLRGDREDLAEGEADEPAASSRSVFPSTSSIAMKDVESDARDLVDRDDVGMGEGGGGAGLALEAPEPLGIGGEVLGQHLDGDVASEPRVPRPIDLAHPARAERRQDLVGAEAGAGGESQRSTSALRPGSARRNTDDACRRRSCRRRKTGWTRFRRPSSDFGEEFPSRDRAAR